MKILRFGIIFLLVFCFNIPLASAAEKKVEIAFVLDTTGSMSGLIAGAKKKIWSIANTIVDQYPDAEIRFGLVGYRDLGDDYVTKYFPLTTDVQAIYEQLLMFQASGGNDTPESVNEALDVAVTKLGWSNKQQVSADRIIFLVGDAPPHMDYTQDRKYPVVIDEAVKNGIIVNTVQCGDMGSTRKIWKEMAQLGGGDYLAIPQDGGQVTIIATPYDDPIIIIQRKINATIIPYGSAEHQGKIAKKIKLNESAPSSAAADMASYINKSQKGAGAVTGGGDLVEDIKNGRLKLDKIEAKELPAELKDMPVAKQKEYIDQKIAERESLSAELASLVKKRDEFIREAGAKAASSTDNFDSGVKKTLQKQIK